MMSYRGAAPGKRFELRFHAPEACVLPLDDPGPLSSHIAAVIPADSAASAEGAGLLVLLVVTVVRGVPARDPWHHILLVPHRHPGQLHPQACPFRSHRHTQPQWQHLGPAPSALPLSCVSSPEGTRTPDDRGLKIRRSSAELRDHDHILIMVSCLQCCIFFCLPSGWSYIVALYCSRWRVIGLRYQVLP
jgi:hypothetical protein